MCEYFSCIITKDLKVHWLQKTMRHEDILASIKLEDKKLIERDFVRIEIVPKDRNKVTRNVDDWILQVDEERTLPEWYAKNVIKAQKACWVAWEESIRVNLAAGIEELNVSDDRFLLAREKAKIVASGSVSIVASGSVSIKASGSVSIKASGSVSIKASGSVSIEASGSVSIKAYDSVSIKAYDYWHGTVSLESKTAVLIWKEKVFVATEAEIVKTKVVGGT